MKVGDKLLCKKNYYHTTSVVNYAYEIYTKDEYYIITSIKGPGVQFKSNFNVYLWFGNDFYSLRIREYFYSVKELRKLKLEKIDKTY